MSNRPFLSLLEPFSTGDANSATNETFASLYGAGTRIRLIRCSRAAGRV